MWTMAQEKENITNIEDNDMDLYVESSGKSIDIQHIIDNGFDIRKDANDVIDIVAFMVQYDLELLTQILQGHYDGDFDIKRCFKEIDAMIKRKKIDMDAIRIKLHRLANNLDGKD